MGQHSHIPKYFTAEQGIVVVHAIEFLYGFRLGDNACGYFTPAGKDFVYVGLAIKKDGQHFLSRAKLPSTASRGVVRCACNDVITTLAQNYSRATGKPCYFESETVDLAILKW